MVTGDGRNVETWEPSHPAGGNGTRCSRFDNQSVCSSDHHRVTVWSSTRTPHGHRSTCLHRNLPTNVHNGIIRQRQKVEITQMSRRCAVPMQWKIAQPQKRTKYAWDRIDELEDRTLNERCQSQKAAHYRIPFTICPPPGNPRRSKIGLQRGRWDREVMAKGEGVAFEVTEMFLKLWCWLHICEHTKTH